MKYAAFGVKIAINKMQMKLRNKNNFIREEGLSIEIIRQAVVLRTDRSSNYLIRRYFHI